MRSGFLSSSRLGSSSQRGPGATAGVALAALGLLLSPVLGCSAESERSFEQESPALSPDAEGSAVAGVLPHWEALVARSEAPPAVRWGVYGTPKSLFGALSPARETVSSADARS